MAADPVKQIVSNLLEDGTAGTLFQTDPKRECLVHPEKLMMSVDYLYWFGYIAYQLAKNVTLDDIISAIHKFQDWFGIKGKTEDGKLGQATLRAMQYPRCGCPDIVDHKNGRHKRYLKLMKFRDTQKARWMKEGLQYYVRGYVHDHDLGKTAQDAVVDKAWQAWMKVANLCITRTGSEKHADLIIDVGQGTQDDFDGPAGTLAWSYMPDGSDKQLVMRFDIEEKWIDDPQDRGVLMFNVATHEFGHMLGLEHSKCQQALMAPFYNESVGVPQQYDDINRIQELYGAPPPSEQVRQVLSAPGYVIHADNITIEGYRLVPVHPSKQK